MAQFISFFHFYKFISSNSQLMNFDEIELVPLKLDYSDFELQSRLLSSNLQCFYHLTFLTTFSRSTMRWFRSNKTWWIVRVSRWIRRASTTSRTTVWRSVSSVWYTIRMALWGVVAASLQDKTLEKSSISVSCKLKVKLPFYAQKLLSALQWN